MPPGRSSHALLFPDHFMAPAHERGLLSVILETAVPFLEHQTDHHVDIARIVEISVLQPVTIVPQVGGYPALQILTVGEMGHIAFVVEISTQVITDLTVKAVRVSLGGTGKARRDKEQQQKSCT